MSELVRCVDVARVYGRGRRSVVALHDISCAVAAGDAIAVTGPSGSGKTTLLHLLAGLDEPTAGEVRRAEARAGMVFQGDSLVPSLDALENVALPLLIAGRGELEARREATRALESVGVAELASRLPQELSGGQAQRVALARVLADRPDLVLADEPTGRVDSERALQIADLLAELARTGVAVVVATHDEAIAARLPGRWEMRDGTLRVATPQDRPC